MKILGRFGQDLNEIKYIDAIKVNEAEHTIYSNLIYPMYISQEPNTAILDKDFFTVQEDPETGTATLVVIN